jgi:hypothetical protein
MEDEGWRGKCIKYQLGKFGVNVVGAFTIKERKLYDR